ncbi:MAG: pitrilysin family protein [Candidatus Zixiibacteriota bacterium]
MNKRWVACAVIMLCLGIAAATNAGAEKIFPYAYQQTVLENGLKVIVIPMESPGIVAYYSIVRTGSRDEYEPDHSGFAHFFEHMMFRGTKKYPGRVYDQLMTEMGANANAFTSSDVTCYHLEFVADDLGKVMELESDRFQNLSYAESDFKTEAGAVRGEYMKGLSSPRFIMHETLMNTAYDKHTYKHTTIGFGRDVEAMPTMYEYSKSFFQRYYRPENVVLVIVGDIKPDSTLAMVKKYYGGWQKGYVPPQVPVEPEQTAERRADAAFKGRTLPLLAVAYKAVAFNPDDRSMAACMLLGDLAFGETSDIYERLVLSEQRVQYLGPDFEPSRDPGLATIYAMVKDPADVDAVEEEIYRTIAFYQNNRVDSAQLSDVKSHTRYGFLMGLDTPDGVAGSLVYLLAIGGDMGVVDQLYATIDQVTASDIMYAAKTLLTPEKRTVVLVKGQ